MILLWLYIPNAFFSSVTGETATKDIHLQPSSEQAAAEILAPRQVPPSDSILEEAEEDEEHKAQNASTNVEQSDTFKIPNSVSIGIAYETEKTITISYFYKYIFMDYHNFLCIICSGVWFPSATFIPDKKFQQIIGQSRCPIYRK